MPRQGGLYSELQIVFGELGMVFEGWSGYLKNGGGYSEIGPDNLSFKPENNCEDLALGRV